MESGDDLFRYMEKEWEALKKFAAFVHFFFSSAVNSNRRRFKCLVFVGFFGGFSMTSRKLVIGQ